MTTTQTITPGSSHKAFVAARAHNFEVAKAVWPAPVQEYGDKGCMIVRYQLATGEWKWGSASRWLARHNGMVEVKPEKGPVRYYPLGRVECPDGFTVTARPVS